MWFRFLLSRACVACACAGGRYAAGRRRDQRREPVGVRRHGRHRAGQLPLSLSPFPSSSSSPSVFLTPSFSPSFSFSSSLSLCLPLSSSLFLSLMILTRSPHPTPAADFGAPSANVPHALTPYTPPFSLAPFRTRSLARSLADRDERAGDGGDLRVESVYTRRLRRDLDAAHPARLPRLRPAGAPSLTLPAVACIHWPGGGWSFQSSFAVWSFFLRTGTKLAGDSVACLLLPAWDGAYA